MAIKIEFAADPDGAIRGAKDVGAALEKVADSLDDVAAEAQRAGDATGDALADGAKEAERSTSRATKDMERDLKDVSKAADKAGESIGDEIGDGAKDADKSTDRLEKSFKELADTARRETKDAGDSVKRNMRESSEAAQRDMDELKDEAMQNASETFSSFDGSVDSFVDGIQGTFGGIVSSMGPIGAAIGAGLALAIGTAVAKGEELAEAINTAKERSAELSAEIIAADGDLSKIQWAEKVHEWGLAIEDSREWWEFWQKDAKTAIGVAEEAADKFGISLDDLATGLAGIDSEAAQRSIEALTDQVEKLEEQRLKADRQTDREAISSEIRQRQELITKLETQGTVTEEAAREAELLASITEKQAAADEAAAAALDARNDAVDALQGELDDAMGSWDDYKATEEKAIDPAGYIAAMNERMTATTNFNANVQTLAQQFGLTSDEVQAILDQGVDFAPMLQSIIDNGMGEQYATTIRAMLDGGQAIVDGQPVNATVEVQSNTDAADAALDKTAQDRDTDVTAKPDTKAAEKALNDFVSKKRTATIGTALDTSAADAAMTRFLNKRRVATVTVEARDREGRLVP